MRTPPARPELKLPDPAKRRRALSNVGGAADIESENSELSSIVARALDVSDEDERVLAHVHGFHSYPARLHAETARSLVELLSDKTDAVLDPFCGSGTVAVVTRELGRRALGSDLNPLAVELARLKSSGVNASFTRALRSAAEHVVEHARERQRAKLGPTHPYGREDREEFATHVLLSLDGLRDGIEQLDERAIRHALLLVLSSCLTKLSEKRADSSRIHQDKRIARSFPFRFFLLKTEDLIKRATAFSTLVPRGTPPPRIEVCDARKLGYVAPRSVRLVVSSPPYPGVYDYFEHHETRLRWLRLDGRDLHQGELGSRRSAGDATKATAEWEQGFTRCLSELKRVLVSDGLVTLMLADSVFGGRAYYADAWLPRLAQKHGFYVAARGSQLRAHFHGPTSRAFDKKPRREHLFVLALS